MLRRATQQDFSQPLRVSYAGKVLLIDTDPLDLATYKDIFEMQGHEVAACPSYEEGARRLRAEHFDLVVMDQGGSKFEGRAFLEQLATRRPHITTLALGRPRDLSCYLNAMELGADDYFEKPVSPNELRRAVQTFCVPRLAIGFAGA